MSNILRECLKFDDHECTKLGLILMYIFDLSIQTRILNEKLFSVVDALRTII